MTKRNTLVFKFIIYYDYVHFTYRHKHILRLKRQLIIDNNKAIRVYVEGSLI